MNSNQPEPNQANRTVDWALWAPPLAIITVLILFLIYLLVPGVLLYPANQSTEAAFEIDEKTKEQLNSNLSQKITNL